MCGERSHDERCTCPAPNIQAAIQRESRQFLGVGTGQTTEIHVLNSSRATECKGERNNRQKDITNDATSSSRRRIILARFALEENRVVTCVTRMRQVEDVIRIPARLPRLVSLRDLNSKNMASSIQSLQDGKKRAPIPSKSCELEHVASNVG